MPLAEQTPSHATSSSSGASWRMPRFCPRWVERGRGRRLACLEAHTPSCSIPPRLGARSGRRRSSKPITKQHTTQPGFVVGYIALSAAAASSSRPCSFRGPLARRLGIRELHWHCSLSESSALLRGCCAASAGGRGMVLHGCRPRWRPRECACGGFCSDHHLAGTAHRNAVLATLARVKRREEKLHGIRERKSEQSQARGPSIFRRGLWCPHNS